MVHRYNKDTQQKILKEAADLFMSKGYLGTSTREIAQKVGITQPNLYHYFSDKEKLYTAVLEKHLEDVGKALREIVQTSETTFQVMLTKMAQFLIETHLVDYREPFEEIFSTNQSVLRSGISKEIAARHFFLVLAPYITRSKRPVEEPLNVEQLIDLYLNGVLGQT